MKSTIRPVKGTRDYYPEEMSIRSWIYKQVRHVSQAFGYQEFEGPFLEHIGLYAAKSGDELVKEQSFVFPDRGGDLITLRPELTPSLARMIAQKQNQLNYPLRWWSWGPFWRYERPQKGRTREFFQWNIDLIGVDTPLADAELIAIIATFFKNIGLLPSQVNILVNNRALIESELNALDISPEKRTDVFHLVDKRDKLSDGSWMDTANKMGLSIKQIDGILCLLKNVDLWQKSEYMIQIFNMIEALELGSYVKFSPHIIRGLDYYTGTVFEAWDNDGAFRAILGGGRYDNLVSDVGGNSLPAVGFAMGDMVIQLVLEKFNLIPREISQSPARILVTLFNESTYSESLSFSKKLREAGMNVICYPEYTKLSKQFKYADRMNIPLVVIIGPDEITSNSVVIKNLLTRDQYTIPIDDAIPYINKLLDNNIPS